MSSDSISKMVTDFLGGKQLSTDGGSSSVSDDEVVRADASTMSEALDDYGTDTKSGDSTDEDLLPGSDDTRKDQQGKANSKADGKPAVSGDKEVITVTDESGKKKVEIDYTNRDAIKKAFQFQHGARKWQAERDKALESTKAVKGELDTIKQDWSTLDQAFKQGPEHLFDLLQGRKGAFKEHVQKQIEKEDFLRHASPEEIRALENQERADLREKELAEIRRENEEFKKQVMTEREQVEERALESRIHPSFQKHRFADTLGNADDEHMFDSMLWSTALERLIPYEEKGVAITPELVDREFRTVAQSIRKRIGAQAEKKATRVVDQKKREATENVQAKVMSGYKTGGAAQEARGLIQKGDLTSLLKGWNKYGSLFNK
jgi:hypothetical protein